MLKKLKPTVAIVDSGIGGVSVLNQLLAKFKCGNYIYFADNLYMPYGKRTTQFVKKRIDKIVKFLNEKYLVDKIIIACNTASTSINEADYSNVLTLKFNKTDTYLTTTLTKKNLPNCNTIADKTLASQIEKNIFNEKKLNNIVKTHLKKLHIYSPTLVLGCTHYELVCDIFKKYLPNTQIICNSCNLINDFNFNFETEKTTILFLQSKASLSNEQKFKELIRG